MILPNLSGSKINGATKKIGKNVMLMVSDRRLYSDTFWFTLFHEIGHIMNGDYGISFDKETGEYSCNSKSRIRKFGNRSSGTRKSPFLCLITCPFL